MSVPGKGEWKSTAVSSHFNTFYSDRYLTTSRVKSIHNWLAGIPYEHIIILANTDTYGGGGIYNSYTLTTAHHPMFKPVVVHEFGHSFGGLADEYANLYARIGYPQVEDEYLTKNSAQFHEHLGFALVGTFHNCGYKFGRWYNMVWMEKIIGEHRPDQPPVQPYIY